MIVQLTFPLAAAILGALVYVLSPSANIRELARLVFFCGVFWAVYALMGRGVRIG